MLARSSARSAQHAVRPNMDASAATAKRKRDATDIAGADPAPAAAVEASDAEVEEFYAILRRMRDASRRICGAAPRAPAWRPTFCWEDFATPAPPARPPAQARPDEPGAAPPRAGLDLNAEPEPEAPGTPRSAARAPA
ncbi:protein NEGATIVE REGULATOR OF RESISTANCE-like [Panicum virgatum]|uniref:Uncharacterized protein n=1 Tax=Panicum virgatum TaxID=38727 RepID=A0A8T0RPM0_PANVG|nr:protein NEGATIVE REGULATOR OF RESISTANCE-like [Panicum virgatum]KAG2587200.1 hypothetical protein PVAP13_5NG125662 [Panicum virgatum]